MRPKNLIAMVFLLCCATAAAAFAQETVDARQGRDAASARGEAAPARDGAAAGEVGQAADPAAGVPDLPENQAEIEALRKGELKSAQPADQRASGRTITAEVAAARRAAYDQVLAEQDAKIEALRVRLEAAGGTPAALDLQREIEREKMQTERRLLELQAGIARGEGRADLAALIEAAIAELDAPRPVLPPVDRPVPAAPQR